MGTEGDEAGKSAAGGDQAGSQSGRVGPRRTARPPGPTAPPEFTKGIRARASAAAGTGLSTGHATAGRPAGTGEAGSPRPETDNGTPAGSPSLEGLTIAGITRRRAAWLLAAALTVWIVVVFARQVSDATAAGVRADRMRSANEALATQVTALEQERDMIQRRAYVELAARSYGLGSAKERPFVLSPDASPLPSDAPGSAALRLGVQHEDRSPLDSWLTLLFGPSPGT